MKRIFLFSALIIMVIFLVSSCKDVNTSKTPATRPYNNKSYLVLPHEESQSLLRRKLLNLVVNTLIDNKLLISENDKIKDGDEFEFENDKNFASGINSEDYKKFKANAAEVIVSYKDRLEFYFVPTGISRKSAFAEMGIMPDDNSHFYWQDESANVLLKEHVYYLLSADTTEMKDNDIYFNRHNMNLGGAFNGSKIHVYSNQILEFNLATEYFLKETILVSEVQQNRCSAAAREGGSCTCEYSIERNTGRNIKQSLNSFSNIGFSLTLEGKVLNLNDLNAQMDGNGHVTFRIVLKNYMTNGQSILMLYQTPIAALTRNVSAVNNQCAQAHYNVVDVTPTLNLNLNMTVIGRGFEF